MSLILFHYLYSSIFRLFINYTTAYIAHTSDVIRYFFHPIRDRIIVNNAILSDFVIPK